MNVFTAQLKQNLNGFLKVLFRLYNVSLPVYECYLFATVDAVLAQDRSAACGHPHSSQCVAVNLILLDHSLALLMLKHTAASSVRHFRREQLKLLFTLLEISSFHRNFK